MEYTALTDMPFYHECGPLVTALGLSLVELRVVHLKGGAQVKVVIAPPPSGKGSIGARGSVGIADCARVHRALAARLEELLPDEDLGMEVTSPGMERNIKNAAEFALFAGRPVRVWDRRQSDWRSGIIAAADKVSVTLVNDSEIGTNDEETVPFAEIAKAKLL
jgi:ribosome maturation factor RimP